MLLFKYSSTVLCDKSIVLPAHDRSAVASVNSNACSSFKSGKPSISIILPLNTFCLFSLATVNRPCFIAKSGIAFTRSRSVIPGSKFPVNFTNTDSGIFNGIDPIAAAKATIPEPPGKEIPRGNLL